MEELEAVAVDDGEDGDYEMEDEEDEDYEE